MVSIFIADDHPLIRQALRNLLEKQEDFRVVAEAEDGAEAVRLAGELSPDVVVMDISMPRMNGLEATRQIKAKNPGIIVLVLTVHDDIEHIKGILDSGAAGYLTKSVFGDNIVHAIRSVMAGEIVLSPDIFQQVFHINNPRQAARTVPLDNGERLTAREIEILQLAARGLSNRDIGEMTGLSPFTVKKYLADIFSKLKVASRTEAVFIGLRCGFLTVDNLS